MDEARQLRADRQAAVRNAWKAEAERVRNGMGTRNWTEAEQAELLSRGSVKGYEGHHMISVSSNRALASDPNNIQFLTRDEHINGAHQGDPHNQTNGYYNPQTKTMEPFENNELAPLPTYDLSTGQLMAPGQTAGKGQATGTGEAVTENEAVVENTGPNAVATETAGETATEAAVTAEATGEGEDNGQDDSEGQSM